MTTKQKIEILKLIGSFNIRSIKKLTENYNELLDLIWN